MKSEYRSGAVLSACGRYRPALWRCWNPSLSIVTFIGLNPSTADAEYDDPTIRRCIGFARSWGHGSLLMLNLFDFRATVPTALMAQRQPCSPLNDHLLKLAADSHQRVVAAWGNHGAHRDRADDVLRLLHPARTPLECLGHTRLGQPVHPLYQRRNARRIRFCPNSGSSRT